MRLAVVAAGFTPGEADQLRRAMGAWRRPGLIEEFRQKLITGMLARGLSQRFAEQVFGQIRGFGEYGFPESHAASFALLVYVSAWLKRHHPAAFTAALLGSQPMGFYAPAQLIRDAKTHGVKVLPVDVNASHWHATLELPAKAEGGKPKTGESPALRLGLEQVYGLGESAGMRIEAARTDGRFRLLRDLARRAGLGRESLLHLARSGALASLGLDRRRAVWEAMRFLDRPGSMPLLDQLTDDEEDDDDTESSDSDKILGDKSFSHETMSDRLRLPPMSRQEEVIADYRTTGLSLAAHPVQFERQRCTAEGIITIAAATTAPEGRGVRVAGIVLTRQRPATAKGMIFLSIEDETGAANIVVRPDVWEHADAAARRAAVLVVQGRIQRRGSVVHVVATRLQADAHAALPRMSRDFC